MITSAAQQLSSLRKLYAKAHHQLQAAGQIKLKLEERIQELEAENRQLRRRIGNVDERDGYRDAL